MDLASFAIGLFIGGFSLHVLYLTYFHMFILGRIEKGITETKIWVDNHIDSTSPISMFSLFEMISNKK